jgi:hypothetical protein
MEERHQERGEKKMMEITLPKTLKEIRLQEYAPQEKSLEGQSILVWVDPPQRTVVEFDGINARMAQALNGLAKRTTTTKVVTTRFFRWIKLLVSGKMTTDRRFVRASQNVLQEKHRWYARLWSQGADPDTHWSANELNEMEKENPAFFEWLCIRTWKLIEEHRMAIKKN